MSTSGAARVDEAHGSSRSAAPATAARSYRFVYVSSLALFVAGIVAIDVFELRNSFAGWDFRAFYEGGRDYLHLHSPYPSTSLADLTSRQNFVYPIPTAALFAPISLLPYHVALGMFVLASAGLLVGGLYLIGLRDVRCFIAVLIGAPVFDGLELGTISPILVFLLALIWRHRDRAWFAGTALSLLVLTKIFLWPLAVWLLATRRTKGVVGAAVGSALVVLLAALPISLSVLVHYPSLLRTVSSLEGTSSASLVGLGAALTGSASFGYSLGLVGGVILLQMVVRSARVGDDSLSFRLSIVAALALTPIVWNHYLALLFVPLALVRPRFSPIWLGTAWVIGAVATTVRGPGLVVALAVVWTVVLTQAGVFSGVAFVRASERRLEAAAGIALCAALVGVLIEALPVVPAVAALRAANGAGSPDGTADLRLLRSGAICFRVRTAGVRLPVLAQVVEQPSSKIVVERPVSTGEAETCGRSAGHRNLADTFAKRHVRLSLRILSRSGQVLLSGAVLRLQDSALVGRRD